MNEEERLERIAISEELALAAGKFEANEPGGTEEYQCAIIDALRAGFSVEDIGRANLVRLFETIPPLLSESQIEKTQILNTLRVLQDFDAMDDSLLDYQSEKKGSLKRAVKVLQRQLKGRTDDELTRLERSIRNTDDIDQCTRNIRNWNRNDILK